MKIRQSVLDGVAIGASFACMIHCLAVPLLLGALPAIGQILNIPESFHLVMLAIAMPTSALALTTGYRSHGSVPPVILGIVGITSLAIGAMWRDSEALETGLTVFGSLMLASAHVGNWRRIERKRFHPHQ